MDPDCRAKVAPFHFELLFSVPVTVRFPETDKVEMVDASVAVAVWLRTSWSRVVFPTFTEAQLTLPTPDIKADVLFLALF